MSLTTQRLKQDAKAREWQGRVARADGANGDDAHRRAAAHAHVMTHHALELATPEAHEAAACAHDKVAEMHRDAAEDLEEDDEEAASVKPSGVVKAGMRPAKAQK